MTNIWIEKLNFPSEMQKIEERDFWQIRKLAKLKVFFSFPGFGLYTSNNFQFMLT